LGSSLAILPTFGYNFCLKLAFYIPWRNIKTDIMNKNLDIINFAVSLIIKAALIAARFSGRARKRSLSRLATMDINEKDKEILFLRDVVDQLKMQVSILQKGIKKRQKNPRYTFREKLFILWQMEAFQIPRRRVTECFGIARSTLYRWLHKIEDQQQTSIPANKTPMEIASLIWEITKSNINWGGFGLQTNWHC